MTMIALGVALLVLVLASSSASASKTLRTVLVVGSVNVDHTIAIERLPVRDETITALAPTTTMATGGKGANQAIASAKLAGDGVGAEGVFVFGSDSFAEGLELELKSAGVRIDRSLRSARGSGQGFVLLDAEGAATSVVVEGSNGDWGSADRAERHLSAIVSEASLVMLQREVPESVNLIVLRAAALTGVPALLDVGGRDSPIDDEVLRLAAFIAPNESELRRISAEGISTDTEEGVVEAARALQRRGARSVLVTLGGRGMVLVEEGGRAVWQEALPPPGGVVVDATAAGDAARAAFAVAILEGLSSEECLRRAAAAGAIAVSGVGAVPSIPSRGEVKKLLQGPRPWAAMEIVKEWWAASTRQKGSSRRARKSKGFRFACRLNSMRSRGGGTLEMLKRQGQQCRGVTDVLLNYPQHLEGLREEEVSRALGEAGLRAGAVCTRFPPDKFALGAFTNPDEAVRGEAVELAGRACQFAQSLGAPDLIVWPQTDGFNYNLQVDYVEVWERQVDCYRRLSDLCGRFGVRVSLEFKPTDPLARYSAVPSTGAALLLAQEVDRENFGLTLDFGHLVMAGENPGQSIAAAARSGKLFGIQLGDGPSRLGAEDGLVFGSANPRASLEAVLWLRRAGFDGTFYFDTFPHLPEAEDPVRECETNIREFQRLWAQAGRLEGRGLKELQRGHDALGVLDLLDREL